MDHPPSVSRRSFVGLAASASVCVSFAGQSSSAQGQTSGSADLTWQGLKVGLASYSFNKLPLDAAIKGIRRVGVTYVSIKEAHLPLKSTAVERKAVAQKFRDAGITPLSCGVIGMTDDESQLRNAFEYARDAGIPTIVCKPTHQSLPVLDKLVKEFDLRLAISQSRARRQGLAIAAGTFGPPSRNMTNGSASASTWATTARCGVDPAQALRTCAGRLYDVHFKDLARKGPKSPGAEVGRGVLDVRGMLKALLDIGYKHLVGLEYEKDMADPIPGAAESFGYIRGVLASLDKR